MKVSSNWAKTRARSMIEATVNGIGWGMRRSYTDDATSLYERCVHFPIRRVDGLSVDVVLSPDEAERLGASLTHYAQEARKGSES